MTPFIGVLISWLIVERKSDLAFEAMSAPSRAAARSSVACRSSVTSLPFKTYPRTERSLSWLVTVQAIVRQTPFW